MDFERKKYLYLETKKYWRVGLNDITYNLSRFLAVANKLNLIPILPIYNFAPHHNNGKEIQTNLSNYYDLSSNKNILTEIPDNTDNSDIYIWIPSTPSLVQKDIFVNKVIKKYGELNLIYYPIHSSIKEKAQGIINFLPKPFISIHVRRGDYLQRRPSAYKTTQTVYIFNKILKIMRKNPEVEYKSVYILSNEENLNYFNSLKTIPIIPKVYTVIDFPELIEQRKTDNYVLYLMEKCIENSAKTRISTWKINNSYYSENLDETYQWCPILLRKS